MSEEHTERKELVPGVMRCAKCNLQLIMTNLNLSSGTASAGGSETEPCPNGCGPLWPVTWKQWATEQTELAERFFLEKQNAEQQARSAAGEAERFQKVALSIIWQVRTTMRLLEDITKAEESKP